ncbi:unnamed protein product [Fusarium equiseti]|uniref:Uncharacterized protein n=1 Tax=Fusarium equiseti TaxID=61235 RepID=A0A8J2IWN1_FUSEQ|nr:unnamed protein product [Fusarium equiseti]
MDTSLSAKKDKDKGKSKKCKKEKKEKKEKKGKEKQTISIDLTSPARAHTPPPPPGPDAAAPTAASHTPTRAPSRQNGKRGRSTTRREEEQPPASKSDHTYNSKPLPLFSSNDSTGPPSTGQRNAVRPRAKSAAAIPDRPRTNDVERSSYNHDCKIKTLETCLSLKDRYLTMPPAVQTDQKPFWTGVRDFLERISVTRGKFKDWQAVQRAVESWCQPRRSSMRQERLPAVSQSYPELDELVDQWNLVFAQRFCKIHMGYFSNAIWPQFAEEKVTEMVESNLNARTADILTKRCEALQKPNPSALLPTNSSLEDYGNAMKVMNSHPVAAQTDEDQVRKSETVMSMVLELQPGLSAALSQFLSGPNAPMRRSEPSGGQQESETATSRKRVNSTIPLVGQLLQHSRGLHHLWDQLLSYLLHLSHSQLGHPRQQPQMIPHSRGVLVLQSHQRRAERNRQGRERIWISQLAVHPPILGPERTLKVQGRASRTTTSQKRHRMTRQSGHDTRVTSQTCLLPATSHSATETTMMRARHLLNDPEPDPPQD